MSSQSGELIIISRPCQSKHYVVRAKAPNDESSAIIVAGNLLFVDVQAIADTYDEAAQIVINLGG